MRRGSGLDLTPFPYVFFRLYMRLSRYRKYGSIKTQETEDQIADIAGDPIKSTENGRYLHRSRFGYLSGLRVSLCVLTFDLGTRFDQSLVLTSKVQRGIYSLRILVSIHK
jgi:hypothetical protein